MKPGALETEAHSVEAPSMNWTRVLFDAIDDAVFVHDTQGNILEANPAACRRLGYTRAEMLQLNTRDIDDPEFASGFAERLEAQLGKGQFRCEGRHRTKDGRFIPVDINTSAVCLDGKDAVLAVMRDITQKKRAEDTLARQSELLQSILNNMGEAVLVASTDQKLLLFNPAAQRLFELGSLVEEVGRPLQPHGFYRADKVTPLPAEEAPLSRCIRGEHVDEMEMFVQRPHAPAGLWVSVTGRPLRDPAGKIKGGIIVCRDFTERKRAAGRLAAQFAVARALADSGGLKQAAARILQVVCESSGLDVGVLWLVDRAENCLYCLECWSQPGLDVANFLEATRRVALDSGRDVPGEVWASGAAASLLLEDEPNLPLRCVLARSEGLRRSFGFPLQGSSETPGVIEFLSRSADDADDDLVSMMTAIGSQIGQVAERQRVEAALRDSEALHHSLIKSLPQNIFRKDLRGRLTFANQKYCDTIKMPLEQLIGKTDFDLFPADLAAKYIEDDRKVMHQGVPFETVETHRLPDDTKIYVQVVKTPVYDAQGAIVGVQGIFWDVSEGVRAREVLTDSERRYRQLTEATLDGIIVADQTSVIRLFNPAAERMFGYRADEVIGQKTVLLVPTEFKSLHEQGFQRYVETRQAHLIGRTVEVRGRRKDGSEFPVEIALSVLSLGDPVDNGTKEPIQFLAATRDLTERNKMRAVLVQNEKLASIGLLSAGVAHEINNPIAFVANNLAVLERDAKGLSALVELYQSGSEKMLQLEPETLGKIRQFEEEIDLPYVRENMGRLLERTRDGVERVARIVHSLRGIARTDSPHQQTVHLPDLIEGSLEILHGRFKRSGIAVEQKHDADPRVLCVQTQISQVILNLLVNAFQAVEAFRKTGGQVTVTTHRRGAEMLVEIADNGPGIPEEHMARLFDPFFTTKEVGEGTGLGLAISHNIVEAHGGHIEVESRAGEGATFRVYLPLKKQG